MSSSEDDKSRATSSQPQQDRVDLFPDEALDESDHGRPIVEGSEASYDKEESLGQRSWDGSFQAESEHSSNPSRADSDSASPTSPQRPNKYHGAPSTWRAWTAPEMDLAASLDQLRARDLSVHLYNAFKLRRREHNSKIFRSKLGKEVGAGRQGDRRAVWRPPDVWTAWPMTPEEVPREEELEEWEIDESWRAEKMVQGSTSVLQDILVGQILSKARQTFQARQRGDMHADCEGVLLSRTTDQSQSSAHASENEPRVRDSVSYEPQLEPVIMTDDAKALQILQPTIRHLLVKVDDLLKGLHHARAAYGYTVKGRTGVRTRSSTSRSPASGRHTSTKRAHSHSHRSELPSTPDQENLAEFDASPSSTNSENERLRATSRRSLKTSARRPKLGLRDWSDILALASMTGWDSAVIERTARRCSELFGEGIVFRTLEEGLDRSRKATYLPATMGRAAASKVAMLSEPGALRTESSKDKLLRPVIECDRPNRQLSKTGDLNNDTKAQHPTMKLSNPPRTNDEEMFGGVHVDGFLQPIQGKRSNQSKPPSRRRRKQYSAGTT